MCEYVVYVCVKARHRHLVPFLFLAFRNNYYYNYILLFLLNNIFFSASLPLSPFPLYPLPWSQSSQSTQEILDFDFLTIFSYPVRGCIQ